MTVRREFARVLGLCRENRAAAVEFEAEGRGYTRHFQPKERLVLLGGGHIAQPLCRFAAALGFAVTVVDDRPSFANRARFPEAEGVVCAAFSDEIGVLKLCEHDYVAVITRGHRHDADCLRAILPGPAPKYLGMIGSKRRVIELLKSLEEEGLPREQLAQICAPIGMDIGALTVEEIAISIVAQMIQYRRQGGRRRTKGGGLACEEINLPLLEFLAEEGNPKALLLVYETEGSTPVKSGAMMAVDRNFRTVGTVGGGCGESGMLMEAYHLIGTGESRCVSVDMSNDIAAEDGMVCGGKMKMLLLDVGG